MANWFVETNTPGYKVGWKVKRGIHHEITPYQELDVVETEEWGITLVLDGAVQTTERDEFIYHEMIAHVPMMSHPDPKRVLIIGGGDGGVLREVLRYPSVEEAHLVEIDQRVVEISRQYLPAIASGFDDPRAKVFFSDGVEYVKKYEDYFDVVIVDSSDPVGPAVELFGASFYSDVFKCLRSDGIVVAQSESPLYYANVLNKIVQNMRYAFPIVKTYITCIPTYVSGYWTFTCGSKKVDPAKIMGDRVPPAGLKYYNIEFHEAAFVLPENIKRMLNM